MAVLHIFFFWGGGGGGERAGCCALIVFLVSRDGCVALSCDVMELYADCDWGIS